MTRQVYPKSPFPGMDPYLEAWWDDVHPSMIAYAREAIQGRLPDGLAARIERSVVIDEHAPPRRPDLVVAGLDIPARQENLETGGTATAQVATATEPVRLHSVSPEPRQQRRIVIYDFTSGDRVVSVIELLSPANKTTGRLAFTEKRNQLRRSQANYVEIDLVRRGEPFDALPDASVPREQQSLWRIFVYRAERPGEVELYPIPLNAKLPTIRVPLRPEDADAVLDLQAVLERVYTVGRYPIDYSADPDPPLTPPDAEWARQRLGQT